MIICFHAEGYEAPLPAGHRFPMTKYGAARAALEACAGAISWRSPEPASRDAIVRVHEPAYADAVLAAAVPKAIERRIGFPVTPAVANRSLLSVGGTIAAAKAALVEGYAANLAGGSHHAMPDGGAGYCVLNDLAIAAAVLLADGAVERILVVDLDVHQGDGTALCLAGEPRVFTLSVHAERNFPVRKQRSSLDVGLPDGTGDDAYLEALRPALEQAIAAARPGLILYQAGVDPHVEDRLGRLALSDAGLAARDALVAAAARTAGIPLASTMGGGYGTDIDALGRRHAQTVLTLADGIFGGKPADGA